MADHVHTQYAGGQDIEANLRKAHSTCNKWRGSRPYSPELLAMVAKRRRLELYIQE